MTTPQGARLVRSQAGAHPAHHTDPEENTVTPTTNTPPETPQALLTHSLGPGNGNPAETATPPPGAIWHGACGRWWTGTERSHCGGCHETFSSLSAFEAHRRGMACHDPETVGLIARPKPFGALWGWPGPDGGYATLRPASGAEGSAR